MSGAPARFQIGDTIWVGTTESTAAKFPCPDCLGSREWTLTSPAGSEAKISCFRCGDWTNSGLPSLTYETFAPKVRSYRITGMEVNEDQPVKYLCAVGQGSWHSFTEGDTSPPFFGIEGEAEAFAAALAATRNAKMQTTPGVMEKKHFSVFKLEDARFDQFKNGIWGSWYCYERLARDIRDHATDEGIRTLKEMRDSITEALKWDMEHRDWPMLTQLLRVAEALAPTTPEIAAALEKLPPFARAVLAGEKPTREESGL